MIHRLENCLWGVKIAFIVKIVKGRSTSGEIFSVKCIARRLKREIYNDGFLFSNNQQTQETELWQIAFFEWEWGEGV